MRMRRAKTIFHWVLRMTRVWYDWRGLTVAKATRRKAIRILKRNLVSIFRIEKDFVKNNRVVSNKNTMFLFYVTFSRFPCVLHIISKDQKEDNSLDPTKGWKHVFSYVEWAFLSGLLTEVDQLIAPRLGILMRPQPCPTVVAIMLARFVIWYTWRIKIIILWALEVIWQ